MTTIEKLFVQIFERKNRIIEQVKQQTDLYSQHLASKLLIDGITPPAWLWNPNFNSESSDPKELKKEELISELLLPHPRPAIPYSGGHCSLYNKPVVVGENGVLSEGLSMETHASNNSFNAGDRPTTMPEFHDNDIRCALNCVPELDFSVNSPHVSNIYTVPDQSLARIQRSKSRQKALELRSHCKTARAAKSYSTDENDNGVCSSGIKLSRIASQQLDHDNVLLELEKCSDIISDSCAVKQGIGECLRKEKDVNTYCGRITRSRSSCNLSSHESKSLKLDNSVDIAKEVGGRIMSQSTCIEAISKPVHLSNTASQRVTRSKSGVSRKSPIINSLNRSEGYHLQNVSGEVLPHCPDSNAIANQERKSDYVTETELISDGPVEAQAACSKSNLDATGLSTGLEVFVSRPPSDCSMFVKPKTLDFDDMEKCSLNEISSPMLEKEGLDKSSEKGCTSVKSAISLDKITSANPTMKSLEKQSLEQEVSNKTAEGWVVSFETCVEKCVVDDEEVSESKMNKILEKVEDTSKAFQEIQDSHISHGIDVALSNVGMGLDVEMHHLMEGLESSSKLQVEEDELGFEERYQSTNTPSTFEDVQLGPSVVSSLTKVAVGDFQSFSVENEGTVDATNIILDLRMQGDEQNYKNLLQSENNVPMENKDDSTHTERLLQETKPHFEEDGLFSCCSVESPQERHLCSIAADQTMPEFEGFIIDAEENGQPHIVGDAFRFDKLGLPSTTIECASALEQLCKFASVHTPLSQFSTTLKLHRTPDLYQSVPNGLLEHIDLRSSLNLNNDGGKPLRTSYSYVDEVKCASQGLPYSDCVPYADTRFRWSLKDPPMSPVGELWDRISSKSSSSEKQRSLNPELTCFPIEEDPSISEENENRDVVADTIQGDICSTLMNFGAQREPLAEITEACVNPRTSVSAAERFPDRSSLDSVNTEVSFTATHGKGKQKPGNRHSNKRRCTNEAKESRTLSVSTNYVKKATESLNNRFSKPKLSGKISLRKGGQSLSERESKRKNIVSNITSFVPLVQQKQAAVVGTGKRDIKVKALEAAEAAKRLEEQREYERKMKKETMKLERAKIQQKNLRQTELKNKRKEEERKKKNADIVARKRLREEEERKQKERKRKRIEACRQPREQEEILCAGKVETEVAFSAINKEVNSGREPNDDLSKHQKTEKEKGDDNIVKKPQTEPRANEMLTSKATQSALEDFEAFSHCGDTGEPTSVLTKTTENDDLIAKTTREKSYDISPYQCSDDEDDEEDEIPTRKFIPSWASKNSVALVLSAQQNVDPDTIFSPGSFCSMDEVLQPRKLQLK